MASDFRRRKYVAFFDHLDINRDGIIDRSDWDRYAQVIREEKGWSADEPQLEALIESTGAWWESMRKAFGVTDDQGLTLNHFVGFCNQIADELRAGGAPPQWAVDMCLQAHQVLDITGSGTVDADEYALWLRAIGSKADPAEVFGKLDLNGDGVVSRDEMMTLFGQFFVSEDPDDPGNYLMTGEF